MLQQDKQKKKKQATFKNYAPFTDCFSIINNAQLGSAKNLDVVTLQYNLTKHSNNYTKTLGSL